jgi:hypothetical protein
VWIATGIFLSLRISKVTFAIVVNLMLPIFVYAVVPIALLILSEVIGDFDSDLPEASVYYLPYYYIGTAMDDITPALKSFHGREIWLPDEQVPVSEWLWIVFYAGLGYLAATALVLWRTIAHFDRIVGRAEQQVEQPPTTLQAR